MKFGMDWRHSNVVAIYSFYLVATMRGVSPRTFWQSLRAMADEVRRYSSVLSCIPWSTSFMQAKWSRESPSLSTAFQSAPRPIRYITTGSCKHLRRIEDCKYRKVTNLCVRFIMQIMRVKCHVNFIMPYVTMPKKC